jgi:hypothetical protein
MVKLMKPVVELDRAPAAEPRDWEGLFLADVETELARARRLFPGAPVTYIAMGEEVGKLARALMDESGQQVWKEAVQVAVMAARVAIDGDGSLDALRKKRGLDEHRKARR